MEKDTTILKLVERLRLIFDFAFIEVVDYWAADLCAIGLKKRNRLVYISTFNYFEDKSLKFALDLEIIDEVCSEKLK